MKQYSNRPNNNDNGKPTCMHKYICKDTCSNALIQKHTYTSIHTYEHHNNGLFSIPPPSQDCSSPLGLGRERL